MRDGAPSKTLDFFLLSSMEGVAPAVVTNRDISKKRWFTVLYKANEK